MKQYPLIMIFKLSVKAFNNLETYEAYSFPLYLYIFQSIWKKKLQALKNKLISLAVRQMMTNFIRKYETCIPFCGYVFKSVYHSL